MINVWLTILVAIVSSSSALLATFLSNRSNEKRLEIQAKIDREKNVENLRLSKCEVVYSLVLAWKATVFKVHMDWILFVDGNINHKQLLEKAKETDIKEEIRNLLITIGIYFPSLMVDFNNCQEKLSPASKVYFSAQDGQIKNKTEARNIVLDSGSEFDKAVDDLLQKISAIANFR